MADCAACGSTERSVLSSDMSGDATDGRAFYASLCIGDACCRRKCYQD
jgi:hypothetical protein